MSVRSMRSAPHDNIAGNATSASLSDGKPEVSERYVSGRGFFGSGCDRYRLVPAAPQMQSLLLLLLPGCWPAAGRLPGPSGSGGTAPCEVSRLLVGAPDAQTQQPNVDRGGAVFRCSTEASGSCQTVPFDQLGPTEVPVGRHLERTDDKSGQWFGATLHSAGENGLIVACAPRYVYFSVNHRRREPVGTCFVSQSFFGGFQEFSPCRTYSKTYKRALWSPWNEQRCPK
ncbi:hypothetical protein HPB50_016419 [Hyalomma asiaticum]|uniref:Uncharacterized protein n=1 Tax=Hyalomma asiaticum TaxID=266040 RepID=A0ACB7SYW1_HYAAI|nr:hypothetical protein HPB50_016419 [Hyalomma asiaticum]